MSEPEFVFAVEWGGEFPAEIDSLWTSKPEAEKRAKELGGNWRVTKWTLATRWEAEA